MQQASTHEMILHLIVRIEGDWDGNFEPRFLHL